jgi:hypothetical protein
MDSSDIQSPHTLSDEQVTILVAVVLGEWELGRHDLKYGQLHRRPWVEAANLRLRFRPLKKADKHINWSAKDNNHHAAERAERDPLRAKHPALLYQLNCIGRLIH